jgi:hypothetical protein
VLPRRPRADRAGMPPPPGNACFTVTEVTELSFPPPWAAAVWCPGVPEPTGAVYRPHRDTHFVPTLRRLSYPLDERSIPHKECVPASKPRPPPRLPCGEDDYLLRCVGVGRFPRRAWYFSPRSTIRFYMLQRGFQPTCFGGRRASRRPVMAMSLAACYLFASLAVRGTFCGRCVVVDRARPLAVYEGRRDRQSVRRVSLRRGTLFSPRGRLRYPARRPRADGGGIPPPPRYTHCTVTEVNELTFPPPGASAVWCPGVPEPTGAVYRRPRNTQLYRY